MRTVAAALGPLVRPAASPLVVRRRARPFSHIRPRQADFTHAVVGGGVVGLAIAQELARRGGPGTSTLLLERHGAVGTETSSRNSEVIHAGIYYGASSLKTELCLAGRERLYSLCEAHSVPHRRTGKWIVAQTAAQRAELERIANFCLNEIHVPVRFVGAEEAARREPAVRAQAGILESPTTGIIDSHALMLCLLGLFEDAGGTLALASSVESITPIDNSANGWELSIRDTASSETSTITADTLINSAGLGAVALHNMIVPPSRHRQMFYAKGNYFSYPASSPRVGTLVYPAPEPGHAGLGTHLTLDLAGRIKFGPDVEWVDQPEDLAVNASRLPQTIEEVHKYLPSLDGSLLQPDYAGIRPKLGRGGANVHGKGFVDFYIEKEEGYHGWVNLMGIESPGLTSCLAIAERVRRLLYE